MDFRVLNFFLFIILILLQSCSGGRIGNFLESSFKNIEEPKIRDDNKKNFNNKILVKSEFNDKEIKNIEEPKIKKDTKKNLKKKILVKPDDKLKNNKKIINKKNILRQKRQYQPQSYKIIFILKDVDPTDPIENLSTILRNSDVNFEIEKIERFFESKNKNLKN